MVIFLRQFTVRVLLDIKLTVVHRYQIRMVATIFKINLLLNSNYFALIIKLIHVSKFLTMRIPPKDSNAAAEQYKYNIWNKLL